MNTDTSLHNQRLARNALGLGAIVGNALANIAPAMSMFFGFAFIAGASGIGSPLTIALATVSILLLANTLAEFSRFAPSAGSFVTFNGKAFGPSMAASISVLLLLGYIVASSSVVVIGGGWMQIVLQRYVGIDVPWQFISALSCLTVGVLVGRGVVLSTAWATAFFYFEALLLVAGAVLILIHNGVYLTAAPFNPANISHGISGIGLGFPLAIYLFMGWENPAALAEEAHDPRRNVPRALYISTIAIGGFYIFLAYVTVVGFHDNAAAIARSRVPFVAAMQAGAGGFIIVAYLAGVTSIFSSLLGLVNSQSRILFNSGREGLLPMAFGRIDAKHRTPVIAQWTFVLLALGIAYLFGWHSDPVAFFGEVATLGTIPVILVYMATNIALPVYVWRHQRPVLNSVRHVFVPALGCLSLLYPLWGLIQPGHGEPYDQFPDIALGMIVVSLLYGFLRLKLKPEVALNVGVVADQ